MKVFRYAAVGAVAAATDFLIRFVVLGLNPAVLYIGIGKFGWEMLLTKICATGAVFFWNFGARSRFIFKPLRNSR